MPSPIAPSTLKPGSTRRHLSVRSLLLVAAALLALGTLACGDEHGDGEQCKACHGGHGGGSGAERFEFGRARMGMFRTDSQTGRVWLMPLNGDGGWIERGTAPDLAGLAARNGRFEVLSIGPLREPVGRGAQSDKAVLVRFDLSTGRTWLLASEEAQTWTLATESTPPLDLPPAPGEDGGASSTTAGDAEASSSSPGSDQSAAASEALDESSSKAYPILTGDQLGVTPEEKQESLDTLHNALTKEGLPRKMRLWAVRQLGELDPDLSVPELIVVLDDEDPVIVAEAVRQLGRSNRSSALAPVLKLRNHPDAGVRAAVAETVVAVP
jgi:hypothetical protein